MSLTLNMVGGGSGSLKNTDAILAVTVPAGSSVTITKSSVTLTPTIWTKSADNTLDYALFIIKASAFDSVNPWTVTATDGVDTATDTVIIDAADEYDIELSYTLYLYKAGDQSGWTSMGWANTSGRSAYAPNITYGSASMQMALPNSGSAARSGIVYHTQKANLTNVSTIRAHGNFTAKNNACGIYILSAVDGSGYYPSVAVASATKTNGTYNDIDFDVDVSALSGEYYFAFGLVYTSGGGGSCDYTITEVRGL